MPDSPKIWGTLELEEQGDWLQRHPRPRPACAPTPGRWEAVGGPGAAPRSAWCTARRWEINPSIHHINSDSTNTIPLVRHKLNC